MSVMQLCASIQEKQDAKVSRMCAEPIMIDDVGGGGGGGGIVVVVCAYSGYSGCA